MVGRASNTRKPGTFRKGYDARRNTKPGPGWPPLEFRLWLAQAVDGVDARKRLWA